MDLVNHLEGRLLFAVPKKGRLQQPTLSLLEGSDIQFRRETRLDIALVKNLPLALIFLPAADIPTFVGEGRVDLGITGGDQVAEHDALLAKNRREQEGSRQGTPRTKRLGQKALTDAQLEQQRHSISASALTEAQRGDSSHDTPPTTTESSIDLDGVTLDDEDDQQDTNEGVEQVMDLGFGHCKLQAQVPERGHIDQPSQLIGKNVVTSFVGVTEQYFRDLEEALAADNTDSVPFEERTSDTLARTPRRKLKTRIKYVGGSVEAACALGVADGIVDLVESGETMKAANLKPIATVLSSTAVLIKSRAPSNPGLVDLIANRIRGVITAQKYILCQYNIPRSLLDRGTKITPGKRAPTITALEDSDWVAVSSMVEKGRCAVVMDELTGVGATDVLVFGISNAR